MIAISRDDYTDVVLTEDSEKPEEERTTIQVRPLSERVQRQVFNMVGEKFGLSLLTGNLDLATLKGGIPLGDVFALVLPDGIAGWRNMRNKKGELVDYKKEVDGSNTMAAMATEQLAMFNFGAKVQLFFAILATMQITEPESKN